MIPSTVTAVRGETDDVTPVVLLVSAGAALVALAGLTAVGERRRGGRAGTVVLAGLFFPVSWIVWHAHDEVRSS